MRESLWHPKGKNMIYVFIAAGIFALDFVIKRQIDQKRELGRQTPILKDHIIIRKYYNNGVIFDKLEQWPQMVKILCGSAMVILCGIWAKALHQKENAGLRLGLSLVMGGGASNLYDRLMKGHVVDYFSIKSKNKKLGSIIFNLSDWFIFVGSILVVLFAGHGRSEKKERETEQ